MFICGQSHIRRSAFGGLADSDELAKLRSPADFARLFVVLALTEFFLQTTAFEEFLESAESRADGFSIMDTHSQRHTEIVLLVRARTTALRSWRYPAS